MGGTGGLAAGPCVGVGPGCSRWGCRCACGGRSRVGGPWPPWPHPTSLPSPGLQTRPAELFPSRFQPLRPSGHWSLSSWTMGEVGRMGKKGPVIAPMGKSRHGDVVGSRPRGHRASWRPGLKAKAGLWTLGWPQAHLGGERGDSARGSSDSYSKQPRAQGGAWGGHRHLTREEEETRCPRRPTGGVELGLSQGWGGRKGPPH